jgi:hypothetical protein
MPRWVKASGVALGVFALLAVLFHASSGAHHHMAADAPIEGSR